VGGVFAVQTIFLLENGVEAFMYVGKSAPSGLVHDLLGLNSLDEAGVGPGSQPISLERRDSQISRITNDLMDEVTPDTAQPQPRPHYRRTADWNATVATV
jgi:hypothetical protein